MKRRYEQRKERHGDETKEKRREVRGRAQPWVLIEAVRDGIVLTGCSRNRNRNRRK